MKKQIKRIVITGVTLSGNLGGLAMFEAAADVCKKNNVEVSLASILPNADRKASKGTQVNILNLNFKSLLLFLAPLCLVMYYLPLPLALKRRILSIIPTMKTIGNSIGVLDLSGICFVDKRGLPLLWYNIALTLPALALGVPLKKLSQATGPFQQPLNRFFAKWTLSKCTLVSARGDISFNNLTQLGLKNISASPDVSFSLDTSEQQSEALRLRPQGKFVVICPSKVVETYSKKHSIPYAKIISNYISYLVDEGFSIVLLPHSENSGIGKNNDTDTCNNIIQLADKNLIEDNKLCIVSAMGSAKLAREIIGLAEFSVVSRFHSMIASLSKSVPCITIGWNHKYQEAAKPFNLDELVINYENLSLETIKLKTARILVNLEVYKDSMKKIAILEAEKARSDVEKAVLGFISNGK